MTHKTSQSGFTLVIIFIMSTALVVLSLGLLQTVDLMRNDNTTKYYTKVAEEAAEAGIAYAKSCLEASTHLQTWGSSASNNLTAQRDCNGANISGATNYVLNTPTAQTSFTVGNLDSSQASSAVISATGYTEVKAAGTGTVVKTYTHVIKQSVVWSTSFQAQQSTSGQTRTCGILSYNVLCWGTNEYGQLGNGLDGGGSSTVNNSPSPVPLVRDTYPTGIGNYKVTKMVSGALSNCIVIETGEVYCWGYNSAGQLGNGTVNSPTFSSVPTKVVGLTGKTIVALGVGGDVFCALTSTGDLYCWGANTYGQVGNNTTTSTGTPQLVGGPSGGPSGGGLTGVTVTGLTTSGAFNDNLCAVSSANQLYCWGRNGLGQLGNGGTTNQKIPVLINGGALSGKKVIAVSSDGNTTDGHTCAAAYTTAATDAKVYCWGSNSNGQLGNNTTTSSNVPVAVKATVSGDKLFNQTITEVGTASKGSCVIAYPTGGSVNSSQAYCWGANTQRGDMTTSSNALVPVQVKDVYTPSIFANNKVYGIVGGAGRFCALVNDRSYCWGANGVYQIGDGTTNDRRQPTEASFLRPPQNVYIF